eukprot:GHVN01050366.1.p1 GENE.GHVN01050366.1~~GHVN01050366.1.p1  ORF type:complete len:1553 (+),score=280.84 GHVN01050366.1:79-4659(+)
MSRRPAMGGVGTSGVPGGQVMHLVRQMNHQDPDFRYMGADGLAVLLETRQVQSASECTAMREGMQHQLSDTDESVRENVQNCLARSLLFLDPENQRALVAKLCDFLLSTDLAHIAYRYEYRNCLQKLITTMADESDLNSSLNIDDHPLLLDMSRIILKKFACYLSEQCSSKLIKESRESPRKRGRSEDEMMPVYERHGRNVVVGHVFDLLNDLLARLWKKGKLITPAVFESHFVHEGQPNKVYLEADTFVASVMCWLDPSPPLSGETRPQDLHTAEMTLNISLMHQIRNKAVILLGLLSAFVNPFLLRTLVASTTEIENRHPVTTQDMREATPYNGPRLSLQLLGQVILRAAPRLSVTPVGREENSPPIMVHCFTKLMEGVDQFIQKSFDANPGEADAQPQRLVSDQEGVEQMINLIDTMIRQCGVESEWFLTAQLVDLYNNAAKLCKYDTNRVGDSPASIFTEDKIREWGESEVKAIMKEVKAQCHGTPKGDIGEVDGRGSGGLGDEVGDDFMFEDDSDGGYGIEFEADGELWAGDDQHDNDNSWRIRMAALRLLSSCSNYDLCVNQGKPRLERERGAMVALLLSTTKEMNESIRVLGLQILSGFIKDVTHSSQQQRAEQDLAMQERGAEDALLSSVVYCAVGAGIRQLQHQKGMFSGLRMAAVSLLTSTSQHCPVMTATVFASSVYCEPRGDATRGCVTVSETIEGVCQSLLSSPHLWTCLSLTESDQTRLAMLSVFESQLNLYDTYRVSSHPNTPLCRQLALSLYRPVLRLANAAHSKNFGVAAACLRCLGLCLKVITYPEGDGQVRKEETGPWCAELGARLVVKKCIASDVDQGGVLDAVMKSGDTCTLSTLLKTLLGIKNADSDVKNTSLMCYGQAMACITSMEHISFIESTIPLFISRLVHQYARHSGLMALLTILHTPHRPKPPLASTIFPSSIWTPFPPVPLAANLPVPQAIDIPDKINALDGLAMAAAFVLGQRGSLGVVTGEMAKESMASCEGLIAIVNEHRDEVCNETFQHITRAGLTASSMDTLSVHVKEKCLSLLACCVVPSQNKSDVAVNEMTQCGGLELLLTNALTLPKAETSLFDLERIFYSITHFPAILDVTSVYQRIRSNRLSTDPSLSKATTQVVSPHSYYTSAILRGAAKEGSGRGIDVKKECTSLLETARQDIQPEGKGQEDSTTSLKCFAFEILTRLGLNDDLSSPTCAPLGLTAAFEVCYQVALLPSSKDEVRTAAAIAAGSIAVRGPPAYLSSVVASGRSALSKATEQGESTSSDTTDRDLVIPLTMLNQALYHFANDQYPMDASLMQQVCQLLEAVLGAATAQELSPVTYALSRGAECLSRLMKTPVPNGNGTLHPAMALINRLLVTPTTRPTSRIGALMAIERAAAQGNGMDITPLAESLAELLRTVEDLGVKTQLAMTIAMVAHNESSAVGLQPHLELTCNKMAEFTEFETTHVVKVILMNSMVDLKDHGRPLRIGAYQALHSLVKSFEKAVSYNKIMESVLGCECTKEDVVALIEANF